jgi:hypothetical protein
MAFVFLYDTAMSLVSIAREYGVLDGSGKPNNSYARQLIHKYLRKHSSRAWFQVDGIEAENDKTTPSRESLSDMIVAFFPDTETYRKLLINTLKFKINTIKYDRRQQLSRDFAHNEDLMEVLRLLDRCSNTASEEELLKM